MQTIYPFCFRARQYFSYHKPFRYSIENKLFFDKEKEEVFGECLSKEKQKPMKGIINYSFLDEQSD